MKDLCRALKYFRPDASGIVWVFCLLLLSVALNALKPWPLAIIVDSLLGNKRLPAWFGPAAAWDKSVLLAMLGAAILLLHFAQGALAAAQNYLSIKISLNGLTRVRNALFVWLQRVSLRFHQGARAGDLIYRASWDTYAFQTLFQQGLITLCTALLSLVVMVAVMARLNVPLTLVAAALAPLLMLVIGFFGRNMQKRAASAQQADSRVTSLIEQSITTLPLTQSYTREEWEAQRFSQQVFQAQTQRLAQHGSELVYWFVIAAIFGIGTAAITWLGAKQAGAGRLTVGQLLVFLAYLLQLYEPLNQLSHIGATVSTAMAGVRRVFEILDAPEEVKDRPAARPLRGPNTTLALTPVDAVLPATAPLWVQGAIELEKVCFGYQPGREILHDISFSIKAGESAAIIGPSGVGKSTLLHLLVRFFDPTGGAIKLDGVDLRDLRLKDLRAHIALVSQEPMILPATVAENIAYARPQASPQEIQRAARSANADLFIQNMPDQYSSRVGDGAIHLSVGERQRINLARAFLKDAPILLLDEPTSALDAESEALIGQSLERLCQGRTVLMVAHRPGTIARLQRVVVLEKGRLSESGAPAQLRQAGGYYARVLAAEGNAGAQAQLGL
jgi:ATP-binding cassette subfamily B protein/subfamily B ATP-binding cassette protein MsbA